MFTKFIVVLFVLSLGSCNCGLLNWFTKWTDELEKQNDDPKCRNRRGAEENEITPEIRNLASDKIFSLMDIEEGKLTAETERGAKRETFGYSKTKRCPKGGYLGSIRNSILGASHKPGPISLVKRESEDDNLQMCTACMAQPTCRLLRKCDECNKYCKPVDSITNNVLNQLDHQTVGITNRMTQPKNDNIFSKTMYPISTFREGETKDIICRIIGIADASDIETVTIWVTTFSNNRPPGGIDEFANKDPRRQENLSEQKLRQPETKQTNHNENPHIPSDLNDRKSAHPEVKARFNDYDNYDDSPLPKMNEDNVKENPDLIEGPPPFLRSSNNENMIIVQPKEFESDESDENDTLPISELRPNQPEESTIKHVAKPSFLSRLKELTTPRTNTFPTLKNLRKSNESHTKGGFLKNLLKSRQGTADNSVNVFTSTPSPVKSVQNLVRNMEMPLSNDVQSAPTNLPGEIRDKTSEINEALQEVKAMVKSMQEEARKTSETRLLGSSRIENPPGEFVQNKADLVDIPQFPNMPIHPAVPPHVVDNIKKVNTYFANRAQDALDSIGHPATKQENQPTNSNPTDENHSDMTKKIITDLKIMPQFVLDKLKDTLNGFESDANLNPSAIVKSAGNEQAKETVELSERFGEGDVGNTNTLTFNQNDSKTIEDEALVGLPVQTDQNEEIPTTKAYKSKLEKYLAELKAKRQQMYSPGKHSKGESKSEKVPTIIITDNDNPQNLDRPNAIQEPIGVTEDLNQGQTNTGFLKVPYDLGRQRDLLKDRLNSYINDVKSKKISSTPKIEPATAPTSNPVSNIRITDSKTKVEPQTKSRFRETENASVSFPFLNREGVDEPSRTQIPQSLPVESQDPVVGESNDINNFLPTIPTVNQNDLSQITEKPNKFMKYLEDLRAKKPLTSTPQSVLNLLNPKFINDTPPTHQILNVNESKKDLLKDKIKQYVENLKKPGNSNPIITSRGSEDLPHINNLKDVTKPNNLVATPLQNFKKDLLKNKLRSYVDSLKKPMESRMNYPTDNNKFSNLVRKSSKAQRDELNALKKKLDNLLLTKPLKSSSNSLSTDPIIAEGPPIQDIPKTPSVINDNAPENHLGSANKDTFGKPENINNPTGQVSAPNPLEDQPVGPQDVNLQSRSSFTEEKNDPEDWSNNLGQIVQSSSEPKDLFFIGSGIKLPLQLKQGSNGSMDLSVDLKKLCPCCNSTCQKNSAAIEETVGAILEKESELKDQLDNPSEKFVSQKGARFDEVNNRQNRGQNGKSNISKRSSEINGLNSELTTFRNTLNSPEKDTNEEISQNAADDLSLPKLPTLQEVTSDLTDFGKQLQNSFVDSVHKFQDNFQELNQEAIDTVGAVHTNPTLNQAISQNTLETTLKKIRDRTDQMNNDFHRKLEREKKLNLIPKVNGIYNMNILNKNPNFNMNEYIKNFEREQTLRKLLQKLNMPQMQTKYNLKQIENEANFIIKDIERQQAMNKLIKNNGLKKIGFPKIPATQNPLLLANQLKEKLMSTLPQVPKLQNQVGDFNNNLAKISDAYQYTKVNALENKLKQLDNQVEKYEKNNEKLFAEESQRFFGGNNNNKVIQKEVNLISKVLSWLNRLSRPEI